LANLFDISEVPKACKLNHWGLSDLRDT